MSQLFQWFKYILNVREWLPQLGADPALAYAAMFGIVFTETGLLVGFCLPGDSLLFTAGLLCAPGNQFLGEHNLNIVVLNALLIPAAIIGDTVGYWIGCRAGQALYKREKTLFFRKDHLLETKAFYDRHGGKTIILARFVPLIRTFAPVVAGIAQMPYRRFIAYNVFGGLGWVLGLSLLGYFLGQVDLIRDNLEATLILIVFVSILPAAITFVQARMKARAARQAESGADNRQPEIAVPPASGD